MFEFLAILAGMPISPEPPGRRRAREQEERIARLRIAIWLVGVLAFAAGIVTRALFFR